MKTTLTLLLIFVSLMIFGQKTEYGSHTIIGTKEKLITSYISFDGQFTNLTNKEYTICSGGATVASTIDHAFTIGITGSWIFDSPKIANPNLEIADGHTIKRLSGYFGILMEPSLFGKFPIHITFPCVAAIGGITYIDKDNNYWSSYEETLDKTNFFLLSGGARFEFNIADGVRISFGPIMEIYT